MGTRLGYEVIRDIFSTGFSRVPVYGRDQNDYRGLLYTKDLMLADPDDEMKLGDFISIFDRKVESFFPQTTLLECLNRFKKGRTRMALVRDAVMENAVSPRFVVCGVLTLEDIVEEILQAEIVDETDVYVDVDKKLMVADGREERRLHLEVFNPVWKAKRDKMSREEIAAVAAHLGRGAFCGTSDMALSVRAIEWLVSVSDVHDRIRQTPQGVETPADEDWIYWKGRPSDKFTLVLQGRIGMHLGQEGFRSEVGAFSVMGRGALKRQEFHPDFDAFLVTPKVRLLVISKRHFEEASVLDKDKAALENAHCAVATGEYPIRGDASPTAASPSQRRRDILGTRQSEL